MTGRNWTARWAESPLIGINNRDLNTFETTLETTKTLAPRVPEGRMVISKSGLFTPGDLAEDGRKRRAQFPDRRKPDAAGGRGARHARFARQPRPGPSHEWQAHPFRRGREGPYGRCLRQGK
jgi:hypothetical protein